MKQGKVSAQNSVVESDLEPPLTAPITHASCSPSRVEHGLLRVQNDVRFGALAAARCSFLRLTSARARGSKIPCFHRLRHSLRAWGLRAALRPLLLITCVYAAREPVVAACVS